MHNRVSPVPPGARAIPVSPLDNYEADLLKLLLACEEDLPNGRNGKAVASGDAYADDVLKRMRSGQSREVRRLVAVLLAFLKRGSKRARVVLFADRLRAILEHHGAANDPRPIRLLNRRETREDGLFDLAQLRVEADTDDLQALESLVQQGAFYKAALDELLASANERIVAIRSAGTSERRLTLMES